MASKQSKTILIAALLVAAAIGLIVWVMPSATPEEGPVAAPEVEETPAQSPSAAIRMARAGGAAPKPAVAPVQPPPQAAPAAAPTGDVDLFAGEMPDFMADLHARVLAKRWLGAEQQKQLYKYGQEHKDDARPQLLLAYDARNREWDGIAAQMYAIAFRADPRSKEDPNMLNDLIAIASMHDHDRVEGKDSIEILQKAYGADALPTIEQELAKANAAGQVTRATRLNQLKEVIR